MGRQSRGIVTDADTDPSLILSRAEVKEGGKPRPGRARAHEKCDSQKNGEIRIPCNIRILSSFLPPPPAEAAAFFLAAAAAAAAVPGLPPSLVAGGVVIFFSESAIDE